MQAYKHTHIPASIHVPLRQMLEGVKSVEADVFARYHLLQIAWKKRKPDAASQLVDLLTCHPEPLMIWHPLVKVDLPRLLAKKETLLSLSDAQRLLHVLDLLRSTIQNAERREERWKDHVQRTLHSQPPLHSHSSAQSPSSSSHTDDASWKRPEYGILLSDDAAIELKPLLVELLPGVLRSLTTALAMGGGLGVATPAVEEAMRKKGQFGDMSLGGRREIPFMKFAL